MSAMKTKGQRALVILGVQKLLTDEDIADMSAKEKREAVAVLQRCIDLLEGKPVEPLKPTRQYGHT